MKRMKSIMIPVIIMAFLSRSSVLYAQTTQIKGFAEALMGVQKGKASFALGEQDLFISIIIFQESLSFCPTVYCMC